MAARATKPRRGGTPSRQKTQAKKDPVLTVTRYDNVRAFMLAIVVALVMGVVYLFVLYFSQLEPTAEDHVALEIVEVSGGFEDGALDETLNVDSPDPPTQDASLTEVQSEVTEMQETLDNVIEVSDQATAQAPQQFQVNFQNTGKKGSATGSGRRALGSGGGEGAGIPRSKRWKIVYSESGTIDTYAQELDYFGIEFGLLTNAGQLHYVKNFSQGRPTTRTVNSGKDEKRLFFTPDGGSRIATDRKLFQKAGINANSGKIFHFYPPNVENILAGLELKHANRPVEHIRNTYFGIRKDGQTYKFIVTRQTPFQ